MGWLEDLWECRVLSDLDPLSDVDISYPGHHAASFKLTIAEYQVASLYSENSKLSI